MVEEEILLIGKENILSAIQIDSILSRRTGSLSSQVRTCWENFQTNKSQCVNYSKLQRAKIFPVDSVPRSQHFFMAIGSCKKPENWHTDLHLSKPTLVDLRSKEIPYVDEYRTSKKLEQFDFLLPSSFPTRPEQTHHHVKASKSNVDAQLEAAKSDVQLLAASLVSMIGPGDGNPSAIELQENFVL